MPSPTGIFGQASEKIAATYLEQHGYHILERNFRSRFGEIDIVAEEGITLCFVEVRSVQTDRAGTPVETVRSAKQARLIKTARQYLASRCCENREVRFDVLGITYHPTLKIELIKGAFESAGYW